VILKEKAVLKLVTSPVAASQRGTGAGYHTRPRLSTLPIKRSFLVSSIMELLKNAPPSHTSLLPQGSPVLEKLKLNESEEAQGRWTQITTNKE
jgi:hypothetical protein